ncbi:MAG TPA: AAA family ATPase [Streptosporangiaceae bacterium]|nr:AAA family ATPase [Streptosporangiaceae bacterium]
MGEEWFVGRGEELELIRGLLAGVAAGIGGSVLIEGEQGIGKTTLLTQALSAAAEGACHVAWASADELGQQFPLGLMTDCFGPQGRLAATGETADADPTSGIGSRHVLAGDPVLAGVERMLELADRLCATRPLLVVAEDLQWADEASVLVWNRLSRAARQAPMLVVGSLRPAPARDDLAQLRRGVTARGGHIMTLGPLAPPEVTVLVGKVVGARPGRRLEELTGQAGGNPLYARELADSLVRSDRVRVIEGVAEFADHDAEVAVPVSLAGVISARLASLSEDATGVLRWAAVLGQEFSVSDLRVVTGLDASDLIDVIAEAIAADVAAEAGPRMRFRHGLIRETLYESMPASLRSALHLQAARALADAGAAPERVAAQLVAGPGVADRWVRDWLAGAAPVLAYRAPKVTADLLRSALADLTDDQDREPLEAVLVQVEFLLMRDEEVETVGRKLLATAHDPDKAAEIAWLVAYTVMRTARPAEAAEMVEQALARPGRSDVHTARLNALYAMTLVGTGRVEVADEVAAAALASAQAIGDKFAAGYALQGLMWRMYHGRDFAGLLDGIDEALEVIGDDPQTIDLRLMLLMNRFSMLDTLDRRDEALATAQRTLALGERVGTSRLSEIRSYLAAVYFDAGQWDDANAQLENAIAAPEPEIHKVLARALAALIAGHRDDSTALEEHLTAIKSIPVTDIAWGKPVAEVFLARAVAAERAGQAGEAEAALAQYTDPELAKSIGDMNASVLPMLTRLAVAAGHDQVANQAYAAATERETETTATHCRGLIESDPAALMAVAEALPAALLPLQHAHALENAAVVYAERTELQAARAAFAEAVRLYDDLGATWDIRRATGRLRPHGIRRSTRSRRRPDFGWDALTATELKIAYLVADGRSNPDIAAELFLSRNTVQTHVSHILTKLGTRSRTEIAAEVVARPPLSRCPPLPPLPRASG